MIALVGLAGVAWLAAVVVARRRRRRDRREADRFSERELVRRGWGRR